MFKLLIINPGSTSTKIGVYEDEKQVFVEDIPHTVEELQKYDEVTDQFNMRKQLVVDELKKRNIPLKFDAVVGRGGLSREVESGVYEVNQHMVQDAFYAIHKHACDLGCIIAYEIANEIGCRSYIADPGRVDELSPLQKVTGTPLINRICIWHALNQKAIARRFAAEHKTRYEDLNLIMCHLGGGISIAAHDHGRAIDANNALDGEGPFSPERTGTLPVGDLIRLCFSGKFTENELLKRIAGKSGMIALMGTNDMREIERRVNEGDEKAKLYTDAMIWHTAKYIAAEGAVLCGKVDAIILTGGLCRSEYITGGLKKRLDWMAPVYLYPGQDEMKALALNTLHVLRGEWEAKQY
ncbi:MAG: butyrate kinase [Bacteroidales bacterium]|nr:butyrate kinase [Bacteroidales bacterium]MDY4704760.1 butyrate kinase [Prevotella sp.]MCI7654740.1 butyrate kinase [Bacteroidales bacterium]MDD7706528.1 butyrate kinase [Bacteroidales bacterium]MDY4951640.1 butyrate kinase [Prevotella sp.]